MIERIVCCMYPDPEQEGARLSRNRKYLSWAFGFSVMVCAFAALADRPMPTEALPCGMLACLFFSSRRWECIREIKKMQGHRCQRVG